MHVHTAHVIVYVRTTCVYIGFGGNTHELYCLADFRRLLQRTRNKEKRYTVLLYIQYTYIIVYMYIIYMYRIKR